MSKFAGWVCAALLSTSLPSMAQQPPELYLSKEFWQTFQWDKATASKLWRSEGWAPYTGEQDGKLRFEKQRRIELGGIGFDAYLAQQQKMTEYPLLTSIVATELKRSQCRKLAGLFEQRLGHPIENDSSVVMWITETSFVKTESLQYQWDVGSTRISGSCLGVVSDSDEGSDKRGFLWSVTYQQLSTADLLVPKFALSCTRELSFIGSGDAPEDVGSIVFWVNPRRSTSSRRHNQFSLVVLRSALSRFGSKTNAMSIRRATL